MVVLGNNDDDPLCSLVDDDVSPPTDGSEIPLEDLFVDDDVDDEDDDVNTGELVVFD